MRHPRAFTLVELLVVVIILGVLGAIVLPRFSNATAETRRAMLAETLRTTRAQLAYFKGQHRDVSPGYSDGNATGTPTEAAFVAQMTQASKETGQTAEPGTDGFPLGPYLSRMPPNPLNEKATVQVIANTAALPSAGDDSHGWIYHAATLTFKADSPGADDGGTKFIEY